MWSIVIDGVIIALIVICAIYGAVKGLFDSLLGLIGTGVALVGAALLAKHATTFINKLFGLEDLILTNLDKSYNGGISVFGQTLSNLEVAKFAVWLVTVIILFCIIKLTILILAKIFESVTKKSPTISGMNRLFGMVFGIIRGVVISFALLCVASIGSEIPLIGTGITNEIAKTKIASFEYKYADEFVEKQLTPENIQDIIDKVVSDNNVDSSTNNTETA